MIEARAKKIKLLILDVDGVMTDGRIIYDHGGDEIKLFHVRDGLGIVLLHRAGIPSAIITANRAKAVVRRARELGMAKVYQNAFNKRQSYQSALKHFKLRDEEVCFMGDDLIDLPILTRVGLAVGVANAHEEVKSRVHYVTRAAGGHGAIREVVDLILKAQGRWEGLLGEYLS